MATNGQAVRGRRVKVRDTDLAYTGPGTLAGRYLRRFWQPVYRAEDLAPGRAVPLRILGEDFTLYRGQSGVPHVIGFRCAHRATQLSTGWVEGDCLRCFYHGWKYDATGQCVEQPAEDAAFTGKVRIPSYPTEEYLGLVFAYLGDAERGDTGAFRPPPLPRYRDLEEDGVLEVSTYVRGCNYFNALENSHDPVHLAFVHRRSIFTDGGLIGVPEVAAEETAWGVAVHATRPGGGVRTTQFCMPNSIRRNSPPQDPEETKWQEAFAWRVPIDDHSYRSFNLDLVHLTGEAAERYRQRARDRAAEAGDDGTVEELAQRVLRGEITIHDIQDHPALVNIQDTVAQVGQGLIPDRARERLGRSDVAILLIRKIWRRELQALAEGRPLKQWARPEQLALTTGV
jgi:5,5'-dehydrodivanillate O-demethylase